MKTVPAGGRFPGASLLLVLPALLFALVPALAARCSLERRAVLAGEVWRLLTGHWTHWSWDHLLWDLSAFAGLAAACELLAGCGRRRMLAAVGLSALVIPLVVGAALPGLPSYRGLSGIDSALFVLFAVSFAAEERAAGRPGAALLSSLALAAFLAKCGWEAAAGRALFVAAGPWVPVPLAHLAGGLCGLLATWGNTSPGDPAPDSTLAPHRLSTSPRAKTRYTHL